MSFLQDKIRAASQKYYSGEEPIMTDAEFDRDLDQLKRENPDDPLIKELGHGYNVNLDSTPGAKFNHLYSEANGLDKAYSYSELKNTLKDGDELGISLKLDGLSVILYYLNGKLDKALTRGKNNIGIDITAKVLEIEPSYASLNENVTGAFRGEILMTDKMFEIFKRVHPDAKNSRNSAAGVINAGDDHSPDLRFLNIWMYSIFGFASDTGMSKIIRLNENDEPRYTMYRDMMAYLVMNFKHVVPFTYDMIDDINYLDVFDSHIKSWSELGLPSDGIVLTDMMIRLNRSKNPLPYELPDEFEPYSFDFVADAFKFKSETADTRVVSVEWDMTRQNRCMPVVVVEPVTLAGTTVQKCTGYNAKYIEMNRIHPGTIVEIEKRGEIIPNINRVIANDDNNAVIPNFCPVCHRFLKWKGVDLVCPNPECSNTKAQDALIWCKTIAPVDGLSDKLISKFVGEFASEFSIEGIMNISITSIKAMNDSSHLGRFCKMIEGLHHNEVPCDKALLALNIPRLGEETAKKLGAHKDVVHELIHTFDVGQAYMKLIEILGQADSRAISDNLTKLHRLSFIESRMCEMNDVKICSDPVLVAVTGKLSTPRSKFEKELSAAGFKLVSTVNKKTKMLITDNPNSSSGKSKDADSLGIPKITELEFRTKYLPC